MKEVYQQLYDRGKYGNPEMGRCPGVRMYDMYSHWLTGRVFDWGCGNGSTVTFLKKKGFDACGMDWVKNPYLIDNITKRHDFSCDTALCLDVLEHIPEAKLDDLLRNIAWSKRQVISVNNKSCIKHGKELHITLKSFEEWELLLTRYFNFKENRKWDDNTRLYLCEKKNEG